MHQIDGKTRVCGLIGNPVEHTLSPMIHNFLADEMGIDLAYVPFEVKEGALGEAILGAYALNVLGLNITVPYKSQVIGCLKGIDPLAKKIGAVNTLVRQDGGYVGYNTDMTGLRRAILSQGMKIKDENVILIGAGGAARAVAFLCMEDGASHVWILNRTLSKAETIAGQLRNAYGKDNVTVLSLSDYDKIPKGKYLALQATSVGLKGKSDMAAIEDDAFYEMIHTGIDLIYNPTNTKFMRLVNSHGGKAYNGLMMLAYQAIDAFELWTGISISDEVTSRMLEMLSEKTAQ